MNFNGFWFNDKHHDFMFISLYLVAGSDLEYPAAGTCPTLYLPPANEVWGKVIFSQVCVKNSVHSGGLLGQVPPWDQVHPPDQVHSPGPGTPTGTRYTHWDQVHPPNQVPPGTRYTPWGQVHPLGQVQPHGTRYPPGTRYTPWEQCMPGDMGNKRTVRILLECILVYLKLEIFSSGIGTPKYCQCMVSSLMLIFHSSEVASTNLCQMLGSLFRIIVYKTRLFSCQFNTCFSQTRQI